MLVERQIETLRNVKETIRNPKSWTRDVMARDADGSQVDPLSPEATSWCLLGACQKVVGDCFEEFRELQLQISKNLDFEMVSDFNDRSTHQNVLDFLSYMIAKAEERHKEIENMTSEDAIAAVLESVYSD